MTIYSENEIKLFESIPGFNVDALNDAAYFPFMAYKHAAVLVLGHNLKGPTIECLKKIIKYFMIDGKPRETPEFESLFDM